MTRPLSQFEETVLERLREDTGREQHGDDPWERSFVYPNSPAESRAMATLFERGLVERKWGRPRAKLPHGYRAKEDE